MSVATQTMARRPLTGPVHATDPRIEAALREVLARGEVGVQVAAYVGETLVLEGWASAASSTMTRRSPGTGRRSRSTARARSPSSRS
jgi:hypothetical protein